MRTNLTYIASGIATMNDFDLPCVITIYGRARSSKTTLAAYMTELICAQWYQKDNLDDVDKLIVDRFKFVEKNYLYDEDARFVDNFRDPFCIPIAWIDESKLAFDRRRSMSKKQVSRGNMLDLFADQHMITFILCHNLSDLDQREIELTNIFIGIDRRGHCYINCAEKGLPIIKELSGFDVIQKNPVTARGMVRSKRAIRSMNSFICDARYPNRSTSYLYQKTKEKKDSQREKLVI